MKLSRIILFCLVFLSIQNTRSHALWIETAETGKKGVSQSVKVYFAEVGESREAVESKEWSMVKNFELWLQNPDGKLSRLEVKAQKDHYESAFKPDQNGMYQVMVKNTSIGILNFPNTPAFIPYFYAVSNVEVGNAKVSTIKNEIPMNLNLITRGKSKQLNVSIPEYAEGKAQLTVFTPSGELKTFQEVKNGVAALEFTEKGVYHVELQFKDEKEDEGYKFIIYTLTSNLSL